MKISIITVCFNSGETLKDTIQSVKEQSFKDIEYIIVDGNSKDNTLDIIIKNKSIITKWISEPDKGLYDAMNKGIKMATGDVVGFINSDDLLCDNRALEKVVKEFEKNPELDGVYANLYYVAQNNTNKIVRQWISGKQKKFSYGWHPGHPTLYLKKKVYENYGLFDLGFKLASDFEIMLRFIDKYQINIFYLPEFLVKMRLGGTTNESWKNIYHQNLECIRAFKVNGLKVNSILYPFYRMIPKLLQFNKYK